MKIQAHCLNIVDTARACDWFLQLGFGSGFKVNSAVWVALRSFKDDRHEAWRHIGPEDTDRMWGDLEGMGVRFVDGVMPAQQPKEK